MFFFEQQCGIDQPLMGQHILQICISIKQVEDINVLVSNIFYVYPYLGKIPILTN